MNNQNSQPLDDQHTGSEFSRHWLLVLVCAVGIGVGGSALPFYTQGIFIEAWIADFGWTRAQASFGWRGAYFVMAGFRLAVGTVIIVVLSRLNAANAIISVDSETARQEPNSAKASRTYWTIMGAILR